MSKKVVGNFTLTLWEEGYPLAADLEHVEPNGEVARIRLFGEEELHDLRFAVERIIDAAAALNPGRAPRQ